MARFPTSRRTRTTKGRLLLPTSTKFVATLASGAVVSSTSTAPGGGVHPDSLAFGNDYRGGQLVMGIDKILGGESGASLLVGGDFLGIGYQRFSSAEDSAELRASTFPLRAHLGLMYKVNKTSAIELSPFVAVPLPMRQVLTTDSGEEHDMGVGLNPFQYGSIGIELSYYYGDFSKPRKKGKKGKKVGAEPLNAKRGRARFWTDAGAKGVSFDEMRRQHGHRRATLDALFQRGLRVGLKF